MDLNYMERHYFSMPDFLLFFIISFLIVCLIHLFLLGKARRNARGEAPKVVYQKFKSLKEEYYELLFSSTSMLLFTGIYFVMDYRWADMPYTFYLFWDNYSDFILLGLMILSIVLINIMDNILIPLKKLDPDRIAALRMASVIYMLILFAYIKFIYEDNNYDTILFYFITMLIGRYVYMDATVSGFRDSFRGMGQVFEILLLVLLSTALLALYGFKSGYLLTSNSVALSLFIAHAFVIVECFLLTVTGLANRIAKRILVSTMVK